MRVGLFSPYFSTMGGGERYFLTAAEFFLRRGDKVEIFWEGDRDITRIKTRFDLDLSGVDFVSPEIFFHRGSYLDKLRITSQYDLLFFLSDGSIPLSFASKNILHFQVPFNNQNQKTLPNKIKLSRFNSVICNSQFTKKFIDKNYGIDSEIVYPPVAVDKFAPGKKEKIILSVGRFFGPMHPKKHEVMLNEFVKMHRQGLPGWRLVLIGGVMPGTTADVERLRQMANGNPITIITDSTFALLRDYYSRASIYWHATGYGEDLIRHPERAEHFGISTVEAMASGCVPVVFGGGGQPEIVTDGINGILWKTTAELGQKTRELTRSTRLLQKLAKAAIDRSQDFSKERFFAGLAEAAK